MRLSEQAAKSDVSVRSRTEASETGQNCSKSDGSVWDRPFPSNIGLKYANRYGIVWNLTGASEVGRNRANRKTDMSVQNRTEVPPIELKSAKWAKVSLVDRKRGYSSYLIFLCFLFLAGRVSGSIGWLCVGTCTRLSEQCCLHPLLWSNWYQALRGRRATFSRLLW